MERLSEISPELLARMIAHFRAVAKKYAYVKASGGNFNAELAEVRAIVAELPEPIDDDLIEAREVVCAYHHDKYPESSWHQEQAASKRAGYQDQMLDVQAAYFGIKRGRELARSTPSNANAGRE